EPAANGGPDEMPGAMPEILPSPGFDADGAKDKNIDRCWTCRSMFMQAWGNYGTAWPVVHQWLGVRPDLGIGRLSVVPQVPPGQSTVQGSDIRLGRGSLDVRATHSGDTYRTVIDAERGLHADRILTGHTLPRGARPDGVWLDGHRVHNYKMVTTNRGVEITVATRGGHHTLTVTT
ncbi:MAG: glycogen debranching protein, partial [Actinobacteria bacterium]|nr:glycogen debranching protein [Actinomycetota bacterium]